MEESITVLDIPITRRMALIHLTTNICISGQKHSKVIVMWYIHKEEMIKEWFMQE